MGAINVILCLDDIGQIITGKLAARKQKYEV